MAAGEDARGQGSIRRMLVLLLVVVAGVGFSHVGVALAAAPSNDDFAHAMLITALPFSAELDTSEATSAGDDPGCAGAVARSVWFKFTSSRGAQVRVDTSGSDHWTVLSIYTGARGSLRQIACV